MKPKCVALALFLLCTTFLNAGIDNSFIINGSVDKQYDNQTVRLSLVTPDSLIAISVDTIKDGQFILKGAQNLNHIALVELNDPKSKFSCDVFLEQGNISVSLDSTSFVTGTPLNDLYQNYMSYSRMIDEVVMREYRTNIENKENPQTEHFDSLMIKRAQFKSQFQIRNIHNIVGKTVYVREVGTFWDPLFFQNYDLIPSDVKENPNVVRYASVRKEMDEMQTKISLEIGTKLKDTQFTTVSKDKAMISDFIKNSEYLYIDIWASWCAPCIREFPNLKKIHDKYKDKGLNVLLISIDKDYDAWISAISSNQIGFANLVDQTEGKKLNNVFAFGMIPHGILLDKNGIILANQLRTEDLIKKMREIYGD